MPLHVPVTAAVLEPRYSFAKQVTKNWTGSFYNPGHILSGNIIGISFDENGNFWFWTRIDNYETRLYKVNWATGVITEEVIWDTGTDLHYNRGMIILSTGEIYSLATAPPVHWMKYRLCYCGTVSSPAIPDIDNYIWTDEGVVPSASIKDIFKDQNDDIFGYDHNDFRFIKRTGINTYSDVCPISFWNLPEDVGRSIKVGSTLYVKSESAFLCIKNPSVSLVKQDALEVGMGDLLQSNRTGMAYNPSDGKVYLVYEDSIYIIGEEKAVMVFAELSLMA